MSFLLFSLYSSWPLVLLTFSYFLKGSNAGYANLSYYSKPYKEKEYTNTIHPVDTEGFIAALQQVNKEMTILRENS